jgi:nitroreductase
MAHTGNAPGAGNRKQSERAWKTMDQDLYAGRPCPELYNYLIRRKSVKKLGTPGPDKEQIGQILQAAARVPDHGKLFPWYFIVFEGEARQAIGPLLEKAWLVEEPEASPAKLELEGERFLKAPVVIAVVSKIRESKNAAWEQILSAGAACMNLTLAANALGFATNWLTEWYCYSETFCRSLGLGDNENIAGFIHIGTAESVPEERARPDLDKIVTWWSPGAGLQKGDDYGQAGKGLPKPGFRLV